MTMTTGGGRIRSRKVAFLACVVATLVVHCVCAAAAGRWAARIDGASVHSADKLQAVFVAPRPAPAPAEPVSPWPAAADLLAPAAGLIPPHERALAADARPSDPPIDLSHFLPIIAVDAPAVPRTDWQIDMPSLDRLGAARIVFEILVDEHGQVLRCRLEEPADAPSDVAATLESALQRTPMIPAVRRGSPVASLRRIELLLAP